MPIVAHSSLPSFEELRTGGDPVLTRPDALSIEHIDDILADLEQALKASSG